MNASVCFITTHAHTQPKTYLFSTTSHKIFIMFRLSFCLIIYLLLCLQWIWYAWTIPYTIMHKTHTNSYTCETWDCRTSKCIQCKWWKLFSLERFLFCFFFFGVRRLSNILWVFLHWSHVHIVAFFAIRLNHLKFDIKQIAQQFIHLNLYSIFIWMVCCFANQFFFVFIFGFDMIFLFSVILCSLVE